MNRLSEILVRLENRPYHPARIFFLVIAVGLGRAAEEVFLAHKSLSLNAASHYASFYLATFFVFNAIASTLLNLDWRKTSRFILYGSFVGLLPPVMDAIWIGPGRFGYNYLDAFYPTLHGAGNPYSEAIAAWSALAAFAAYLFLRSRSFWKTLIGFAFSYAALVALVSLTPEPIKLILAPIKSGTAKTFFYLLISYAAYVALNFWRFKHSLKRINHSLPWVLLVFLGASLGAGIEKMTWLQAMLVLFLHQGIIFANDYYDRSSDAVNQREGKIDENDVFTLHVLIVWIAIHVSLVNINLGLLYGLYFLSTTAYHHPSTRLKDAFPLNYAMEGFVASLALLIGMASSDFTNLDGMKILYVLLAFVGFAMASPFKDYKDIQGDTVTGTKTLYVLLAKKGWSIARIHRWVSSVVLIQSTVPLAFLWDKGASFFVILTLFAIFLIPLFFTLRDQRKKIAVERSVWIIIAYLFVLVIVLNFLPNSQMRNTPEKLRPARGELRSSVSLEQPSHDDTIISKGLSFLEKSSYDRYGLQHAPTKRGFKMDYPDSRALGQNFVSAFVLNAFAAANRRDDAAKLSERLSSKQRSDGLWAFDDFGYSVDADTSLMIGISVSEFHDDASLLERTLRTIRTSNEKDCQFGSFPLHEGHSNTGIHPEIAPNALYALILQAQRTREEKPLSEDLDCIARTIVSNQSPDGSFHDYWYPSPYFATYHAVRALSALDRFQSPAKEKEWGGSILKATEYILHSQNEDGGWGAGNSSPFETAYALLTIAPQFETSSDRRRIGCALSDGRSYLTRSQRSDGSWPGSVIFNYYYPTCPGKECPEEWHDRDSGLISTAAVTTALARLAEIKGFREFSNSSINSCHPKDPH